ncbi:SUR7/PalI family protein [Metschnikowia aff. pulcherrima]|uniref:SUR7/PalI family protein n=1 Tax=Metschnikowia aff. pulcherrima TaxID=2163413 RepID=A0A4P6XSU9_9ASCO|nr:SUR7/PalI family protein [Metschnikowia aff. pulcherrima]
MHAMSPYTCRKAPPPSFPMHSGIFFIGILSLICWGIQLLPVISVPITGKKTNYNLSLSQYNNVSFGVFGVCDYVRDTCTSPRIGYSDDASIVYPTAFLESGSLASLTQVQLPSNVTHLISKLLVLHVVAFGFTCLLLLQSWSLLLADTLHKKGSHLSRLSNALQGLRRRVRGSKQSDSKLNDAIIDTKREARKHDYRQLTLMFVFATLSFLLSLLAFLADFLLFVPKLGPLGWIQMLPVLIMAIIASLSCFLKRSIQSRKHLHDSTHLADDMRAKNAVFVEWDDDLLSEGDVFIYSNGFTNEGKNEEQDISALIRSSISNERSYSELELQSFVSERASNDSHLRFDLQRSPPQIDSNLISMLSDH